jgi:hypothetical protein
MILTVSKEEIGETWVNEEALIEISNNMAYCSTVLATPFLNATKMKKIELE